MNAVATDWMAWVQTSLIDGCIAWFVVSVLWKLAGSRLAPRAGAALFALVLVKCVVSLPVAVPLLRQASTASPTMDPEPAAVRAATMEPVAVIDLPQRDQLRPGSCLMLAWFGGVLLGTARVGWLWWRTRLLIRESRTGTGDEAGELAMLSRRMGCEGVAVRISSRLNSPALAGWWRPVLLLPEGLTGRLDREQLRWVLAHELAHVRARDILWQWAETLMRVALFFHPAVWLASAQSARLRERACDEEALRWSGASRQVCARGFVSLIEWTHGRPRVAIAGLGMGRAGREAKHRICALASEPARACGARWQRLLVVIGAALVLPSLRPGHAQESRVAELEKRVAELEAKLKAKSRLDALREKAVQRSHDRVEADQRRFTAEQLREIEGMYQSAKQAAVTDEMAAAFQPLMEKYPAANRTGCAVLLLARLKTGAGRTDLLQRAIKEHGDAYFLDGTNVGGVARLMLAQDAETAGRDADARRWRDEIRRDYAGELDFGAVPLVDILGKSPAAR